MMVVETVGLDAHNRIVTLILKDIKAKLFYQTNGVNCIFFDWARQLRQVIYYEFRQNCCFLVTPNTAKGKTVIWNKMANL